MTAKILIVDCDPETVAVINAGLRQAGFEITSAVDANSANLSMRKSVPDLMLLDWNLPGVTGLTYLHQLRSVARTHNLPVIMLTSRSELVDKIQGLSSGADDYITKPFSTVELLARIRAVLRARNPLLHNTVLDINGLRLCPATHQVAAGDRTINLGPTEFRLLHYFMTHAERLHSRSQLLYNVWGNHFDVEERTVDVYVRRLRAALSGSGHDQLIQTVRHGGYRFSATPIPVTERLHQESQA